MQKAKKIPVRQCLGCSAHKEKREFIRVVRTPEGDISLDLVGKMSGRGAYICRNVQCLKKARKTGRIESALECKISDDIYDKMALEIEESNA